MTSIFWKVRSEMVSFRPGSAWMPVNTAWAESDSRVQPLAVTPEELPMAPLLEA